MKSQREHEKLEKQSLKNNRKTSSITEDQDLEKGIAAFNMGDFEAAFYFLNASYQYYNDKIGLSRFVKLKTLWQMSPEDLVWHQKMLARTSFYFGLCHLRLENASDAIAKLSESLNLAEKLENNDLKALSNLYLGIAFKKINLDILAEESFKRALLEFQSFIQVHAGDRAHLLNYGLSMYYLGQLKQNDLPMASEYINGAYEIFTELNHKEYKTNCALEKGILFIKKSDYQSAVTLFTDILTTNKEDDLLLNPIYPDLHQLLGICLLKLKQPESALTFLKKAVTLYSKKDAPNFGAIATTELALAVTLEELSQHIEAENYLNRALEFLKENPNFDNSMLGEVHHVLRELLTPAFQFGAKNRHAYKEIINFLEKLNKQERETNSFKNEIEDNNKKTTFPC